MGAADTFLKIRIWTKLILLGLVGVYALLFIFLNSGDYLTLWLFFNVEPRVPMLLALLGAFVLGSLLTLLIRAVIRTMQQVKTSRSRGRTERLEREISDMRTKSARLRTRE